MNQEELNIKAEKACNDYIKITQELFSEMNKKTFDQQIEAQKEYFKATVNLYMKGFRHGQNDVIATASGAELPVADIPPVMSNIDTQLIWLEKQIEGHKIFAEKMVLGVNEVVSVIQGIYENIKWVSSRVRKH